MPFLAHSVEIEVLRLAETLGPKCWNHNITRYRIYYVVMLGSNKKEEVHNQ